MDTHCLLSAQCFLILIATTEDKMLAWAELCVRLLLVGPSQLVAVCRWIAVFINTEIFMFIYELSISDVKLISQSRQLL